MKKTSIKQTAIAFLAFVFSIGTVNAAVIANLGADYLAGNVPANYNYAYSNTVIKHLTTGTALTANQTVGNAGNSGYGTGGGGLNIPAILGSRNGGTEFEIFNDGFQNNAGVEGTDLLLHGDETNAQYVAIQYTITAADIAAYGTQATISGSLRRLATNGDGIDFGVYHNDTELFLAISDQTGTDNSLTMADGSFNSTRTVAAGDVITWQTFTKNDHIADEMALRATIDLVPEPETYALIFGALSLGFVMLRRGFKA